MDTALCEGAEELAEGADLLVTECTFSDEDAALAEQYRHLTAGQAGALAAAAGARSLVLSHFSSRYTDVSGLEEQARRGAGGAVAVRAAADLDRFGFPKRRL
jgi:ribonuclease Z